MYYDYNIPFAAYEKILGELEIFKSESEFLIHIKDMSLNEREKIKRFLQNISIDVRDISDFLNITYLRTNSNRIYSYIDRFRDIKNLLEFMINEL